MTPELFTARCQEIVATMRGHEAHRALDLLTNDVLRELGFGGGVAIFEAAVTEWHKHGDPYPYSGPCPNCEASTAAREVRAMYRANRKVAGVMTDRELLAKQYADAGLHAHARDILSGNEFLLTQDDARALRAMAAVREEAAAKAEKHGADADASPRSHIKDWNDGYVHGCLGAASAIRALTKGDQNG